MCLIKLKMEFALVRIDDRLIHGQVVMGWTHSKGVNTIVAVDDEVAKDSFQCSLLQFATPPGVKSYVISIDKMIELMNEGIFENKKVMLLAKGPQTMNSLIDRGVPIKSINVGNVRPKGDTREILSHVYVSDLDVESWKELGLKVELSGQILPDSPKVNLKEIFSKLK